MPPQARTVKIIPPFQTHKEPRASTPAKARPVKCMAGCMASKATATAMPTAKQGYAMGGRCHREEGD
jgi:hypothetical protein